MGGVALLSFFATSSDSLFLMLALAAQAEGAALVMRTAYVLSANLVLLLALLLAQLGGLVSPELLGYLGLVPIAIGVLGLYRWWQRGDNAEPVQAPVVSPGAYILLFLINDLMFHSICFFDSKVIIEGILY